jgi:hypothetical protein
MRRSGAYRLLRLRVPNPPEAWMSVSYECCMLSGRGLCHGPILRPKESYRLWCVIVCDFETSRMRQPWLLRQSEREREKANHLHHILKHSKYLQFVHSVYLRVLYGSQTALSDLYNRHGVCLLSGTKWIFKCNRLILRQIGHRKVTTTAMDRITA